MMRVVVAAPPAVGVLEDLRELPACADLIELRLDLLPVSDEADLRRWIEASPRPVLATVRSVEEGGSFSGGPAAAAARLEAAVRAGASWIDVERDVADHVGPLPDHVKIVVSHHGEGDVELPSRVGGRDVAVCKIARRVEDARQLERARSEARVAPGRVPPVTVVPTGPLAAVRAAFGHAASLLYGSGGGAVVEGQPELRVLLDELRAGEVSPDAALFGLLGEPPSRSPSPALHNAVFRARGRDALYVPVPGLAPRQAIELPFAGFSVTTPWKEAALACADRADATARAVGAANTLTRLDTGGWHAANTDVEAIEAAAPPAQDGDAAFVYGSGGYARAAAFALRRRGYALRVGALEVEEGRAFAAAVGARWSGPRYERRVEDRVLVNATPAGADGSEPAGLGVPTYEGLVVLDAPYGAGGADAGFALLAKPTADRVVGGAELLLLQAAGQAAVFAGADDVARILRLALFPPPCLVLLGLRGAGKTTVGRLVARELGRPFLDLDDEVERITGRTAGSWIRSEGEPAFRDVETSVLARLVGRRGVVVAAGGGIVERAVNRELLSVHAFPVLLDVSPEVASRRVRTDEGDRPPLGGASDPEQEAHALSASRSPLWRALARHVVDATTDAATVAEHVGRHWTKGTE